MRVLHIYKTYYPESQGGLEEAIRQICLQTARLDVVPRVLTLADGADDEFQREEAAVRRLPRTLQLASCDISLTALARFRAETAHADLIHYHHPWPYADLLHYLSAQGKPAIVTYHSDIVRQRCLRHLYAPLRDRFLNRMDRIVATSPQYRRSSPVLRSHTERCRVIPLGIDEATQVKAPSGAIVDRLRSRFGEGFFLFLGVLRSYKGLDVLLDAAIRTRLPVIIAGEGPERARLERRLAESPRHRVSLFGYVSDAERAALIGLARAVVLPSTARSEAFGMALVEGAMRGRALISTDLGTGTSYVNAADETGFVVPPGDAKALAEALCALWDDPERATRFGERSRKRYEQLFSGSAMGAAYRALYGELVDRNPRA